MTWEMLALIGVGAYMCAGIIWSTRFRCWWRGQHDTIKMSVPRYRQRPQIDQDAEYRETVWHCRWCGHRTPVKWGTHL